MSFQWKAEKDFLSAHKGLMKDLVKNPDRYRNENVGIFKGHEVSHMAPSFKKVAEQMSKLFRFIAGKRPKALTTYKKTRKPGDEK